MTQCKARVLIVFSGCMDQPGYRVNKPISTITIIHWGVNLLPEYHVNKPVSTFTIVNWGVNLVLASF